MTSQCRHVITDFEKQILPECSSTNVLPWQSEAFYFAKILYRGTIVRTLKEDQPQRLLLNLLFYHFNRSEPTYKSQRIKPGLHIVVTVAEHASDVAPKRILRLSIHQLQIFLVKYEYPPSLQPCEYQGIPGKLKKRACNHVLAILTTYMETRL